MSFSAKWNALPSDVEPELSNVSTISPAAETLTADVRKLIEAAAIGAAEVMLELPEPAGGEYELSIWGHRRSSDNDPSSVTITIAESAALPTESSGGATASTRSSGDGED